MSENAMSEESLTRLPPPPTVWPQDNLILGPRKPQPQGLPHFGCVVPGAIYRSGQPAGDAYEWLYKKGIVSIVSLREEQEPPVPESYGFVTYRIPIVDEEAPAKEQALRWLGLAGNRALYPMLVHCKEGLGRTSVAAILVRYSFDGWPLSKAMREVKCYRKLFGFIQRPLAAPQREFLVAWRDKHDPGAMRPLW